MADKVKYDKRSQLDDHIAKAPEKAACLVVLNSWSAWAGQLVAEIENYRKGGKVPIIVIEQDGEGSKTWSLFLPTLAALCSLPSHFPPTIPPLLPSSLLFSSSPTNSPLPHLTPPPGNWASGVPLAQ